MRWWSLAIIITSVIVVLWVMWFKLVLSL
jgi:hypothetical protein